MGLFQQAHENSEPDQKGPRCKAREKPTSAGVLFVYVERGGRAQRSRWAFFSRLLVFFADIDQEGNKPGGLFPA